MDDGPNTSVEILYRKKEKGLNVVAAAKSRRASFHRTLLRHARTHFEDHLHRLAKAKDRPPPQIDPWTCTAWSCGFSPDDVPPISVPQAAAADAPPQVLRPLS